MARTYRRKKWEGWDLNWVLERIRYDDESMGWTRFYHRQCRDREHALVSARAMYHSDNYPRWGGTLPHWVRNDARSQYRALVRSALHHMEVTDWDRELIPPDSRYNKGKTRGWW